MLNNNDKNVIKKIRTKRVDLALAKERQANNNNNEIRGSLENTITLLGYFNYEIDTLICRKKETDKTNPIKILYGNRLEGEIKKEISNFDFAAAKETADLSDAKYLLLDKAGILKTSKKNGKLYILKKSRFFFESNFQTVRNIKNNGLYFKTVEKMYFQLTRIIKLRLGYKKDNKVRLSIRGDGTALNRRMVNMFNFGYICLDDPKCKSAEGNYTLGLFSIGKEDRKSLKECLPEVVDALDNFKTITVDGIEWVLDYYGSGDMKYDLNVLGINAANSNCPCLFCTAHISEFTDLTKNFPMNRSLEEATKLLKMYGHNLEKFKIQLKGYQELPLIKFIPYDKYIYDTLHLIIRIIGDKLMDLLLNDINIFDTVNGRLPVKLELRPTLSAFESFLRKVCGISNPLIISSTGIKKSSLTGGKLLEVIKLFNIEYIEETKLNENSARLKFNKKELIKDSTQNQLYDFESFKKNYNTNDNQSERQISEMMEAADFSYDFFFKRSKVFTPQPNNVIPVIIKQNKNKINKKTNLQKKECPAKLGQTVQFIEDDLIKLKESESEQEILLERNNSNKIRFEKIQLLWMEFKNIYRILKTAYMFDDAYLNAFDLRLKNWLKLYCEIYFITGGQQITPYMHVMCSHTVQLMRMYGSINDHNVEGLENVNKLYRNAYDKKTNGHVTGEKNYPYQLIHQRNRYEMFYNLEFKSEAEILTLLEEISFILNNNNHIKTEINQSDEALSTQINQIPSRKRKINDSKENENENDSKENENENENDSNENENENELKCRQILISLFDLNQLKSHDNIKKIINQNISMNFFHLTCY